MYILFFRVDSLTVTLLFVQDLVYILLETFDKIKSIFFSHLEFPFCAYRHIPVEKNLKKKTGNLVHQSNHFISIPSVRHPPIMSL
ncbi:hypothetical protein AYI68_g1955 [Smittium mucronatum]|uniref:Uncharacterized protein n=1 Tax=Smittium mucronatum TaxID=133383 RepID=A0A1R0H3X5_9FUNG|nr:hypothetical protein AYI68_g1955 [Smittium mucronatum]